MNFYQKLTLLIGLGLAPTLQPSWGAEKGEKTSPVVSFENVELFAAIDAGKVEAKWIAKDSTQATVIFKNKSKKPLSIQLPAALVAIPVAAQFGGGGFGGGGQNGGGGGFGGNGGNQALGGGFGGGGIGGGGGGFGGGGGGGFGGGVFNLQPEQVKKLKVTTVCLEHGKREPHARVEYRIISTESFPLTPPTVELLKMLGQAEIDQPSAQAAAWHLANGLSWQQLGANVGAKHLNGSQEAYFSFAQLERAAHIAHESQRRSPVQSEASSAAP